MQQKTIYESSRARSAVRESGYAHRLLTSLPGLLRRFHAIQISRSVTGDFTSLFLAAVRARTL